MVTQFETDKQIITGLHPSEPPTDLVYGQAMTYLIYVHSLGALVLLTVTITTATYRLRSKLNHAMEKLKLENERSLVVTIVLINGT